MTARELFTRLEAEGVTVTLKLRLEGDAQPSPETLELVRTHKDELLRILSTKDMVPRLPWQLERLLRAAASDLLPKDTVKLPAGLVPDLNRYTLALTAAYFVGDRDEALVRLWQVYRAWHPAGISLQGAN